MHEFTEDGNQLFCVDYSPDGSQFATAGRERWYNYSKDVRVFELEE